MKKYLIFSVILSFFLSLAGGKLLGQEKSAAEIIKDLAASYQKKADEKEEGIFGIEITGEGGGEWTICIKPGKKVTVHEGEPKEPTFILTTDLSTLRNIYKGRLTALTAAGRAKASDSAPVDIKFMAGVKPSPEIMKKIFHYGFHFFIQGSPEIVYFDEDHSRFVHGGNVVIFYYTTGLRTAWYQIKKGMVINQDETDQVNPFPTIFICIRGEGKAKLGGKTIILRKGMMVYIPAGMSHMFWNENDEPMEGIIIMFGPGA
jgi:mannose-6-phosphate isomerase-like protein (cupin superfamily)/putative sterol carrier protein